MDINPFKPRSAGSVTVSVTSSSAATALPAPGSTRYVVYNAGSAPIFIEFGLSGQTSAIATGYPVGPGMKETLTVDSAATHIACIAAAAQTLYVSAGRGI